MKRKVKAKYIIAYCKDHNEVFYNGELIYENDTILGVGYNLPECEETFDYGNSIITPGFIDINALGDIDHEPFFDEVKCPEQLLWSKKYYEAGAVECMSKEEEAFKSYYAFAQLISHGITTALPITCTYYKSNAETYEEMYSAAENAKKLGIRAYLGPSFLSKMKIYDPIDGSSTLMDLPQGKDGLHRAEKFVKDFINDDSGLIGVAMVPERIEYQTEETLIESKEFAKEYSIPYRLHAAQGKFEYEHIMKTYGKSTIKYMDSIGILDDKTIIPHVIYASGYSKLSDKSNDDLLILKERGTHIAHCPLVYARGGTSLESFGRYTNLGLNICMGTDTYPCDMLDNIRIGRAMSATHDGLTDDNTFIKFFEAATLGGARALGRDDLGKLCKGAKADFVVFDLNKFDIGPKDNPLITLCNNVMSNDIDTVVINGKTVLEKGLLVGFDYEQVMKDGQAYYDKLKNSFIERSAFDKEGFYSGGYPINYEHESV